MKYKCVVILSEKSSGSTACQNLLAQSANVRHIRKTRHFAHETLYWTKAASVLGMPQIDMVDSEVPIEPEKARRDLIALLQDNLDDYTPPSNDEQMIMQGWRDLCRQHAPVFLEKSPHHLCQWSSLELMMKCAQKFDDVMFLFVGLVRNPMDTIYSQYTRWGTNPEKLQHQWHTAYRNLLKLKQMLGDQVVLLRYEDMVSSPRHMQAVFEYCGMSNPAEPGFLHRRSLQKWKRDSFFGFSLSDETLRLAEAYGYREEELVNESYRFWPIVRNLSQTRRRLDHRLRNYLVATGIVGQVRRLRARF